MAKNGNWCGACSNGGAAALVLIGAAYALQQNGIVFRNITIWPWILIAVGVVALIYNKR